MDHRLALQPFLVALAIAFAMPALTAEPALAQDKPATQQRAKNCNAIAERRSLSGDARKDFMAECLSGNAAGAPDMSRQERMRNCDARASDQGLKGDVRRRFMNSCLND